MDNYPNDMNNFPLEDPEKTQNNNSLNNYITFSSKKMDQCL